LLVAWHVQKQQKDSGKSAGAAQLATVVAMVSKSLPPTKDSPSRDVLGSMCPSQAAALQSSAGVL